MDRGVEEGVQAQLRSIPAWRGLNNPWLPEEDAGQDFSYINLQANPERYTGYEVTHCPGRVLVQGWSMGPCSLSMAVLCSARQAHPRHHPVS